MYNYQVRKSRLETFRKGDTSVKVIRLTLVLMGLLLVVAGHSYAANIYVMSGNDPAADAAAVATLQSYGHTTTLGVQYINFDGTQNLSGFNAVYMQVNGNWGIADMPGGGQTSLLGFVNGGGGLVTTEWTIWQASYGNFSALSAAFPVTPVNDWDYASPMTFSQGAPDPILNAGLPGSFSCPLDSYSGTRTKIDAASLKPGATGYYTDGGSLYNLVGWNYGSGKALMFSTCNGPTQVNDPEFGRLLSNSMDWAGGNPIPEPSGLLALAGGLAGLVGFMRRRRG